MDGEALAILHGLSVARERGWSKIMVESDCLKIVQHLNSGSSSLASFGAIIDSCLAYFPYFQSLSFHFIQRLGNTLAHRIAILGSSTCTEGVSIPSDIAWV